MIFGHKLNVIIHENDEPGLCAYLSQLSQSL
jgi:hypothetical protein